MKLDRCESTNITKPNGNNNHLGNPMHIRYSYMRWDHKLQGIIIWDGCWFFAGRGIKDPNWAFSSIVKFLQFQRQRVEKEEITGATLRNFVKAIKLFCEMSDIPVTWKKISRGLPRIRRYADDRAPTIEEIQKICEYPDRRIIAIVYVMSSSGIRLGRWIIYAGSGKCSVTSLYK